MKTAEQIVAYVKDDASKAADPLGFGLELLITHLPFWHAREFLVEGAVEADWEHVPLTRDTIVSAMREYAGFGWGKVQDHRGLSAGRTITKMATWLWILEEEGLRQAVLDADHAQYGAPGLALVCERFDFPIPDGEDVKRMIAGDPCEPGCDMGCGS